MNLAEKKILVTGGAGFIGSHLVDRLIKEKPASIVVASNFFLGNAENLENAKRNFPELKVIRCDVADPEDISEVVENNLIEVVFNLAVIPLPTSLVKPEWTIRKNIDMTVNLCRLLREEKYQTLIQYSSSEAYGSARDIPMDEHHILDPETPYAASKAATDHIALSYHHTFDCDVAVIRPFNQYGPRQNAKKFAAIIPIMIGKMMRNEDIFIFGDGEQTRDFLYVEDTADATIQVYDKQATRGQVLNIASGEEISMNRLVSLLAEEMDYTKEPLYREARPGDVRRHLAGVDKAREILNWQPRVNLSEGIKKTINWYRQNPDRFV